MRDNQKCSWLIQPKVQPVKISLAFERLNMFNSTIAVYDGTRLTKDGLLWSCNMCNHVPSSLIAISGSMVVLFETGSESSKVRNGGFGVSSFKDIRLQQLF